MEWNDGSDLTKGFQYLYLTEADHSRLTAAAAKPTFQVRTHCCFVAKPSIGSARGYATRLGHEKSRVLVWHDRALLRISCNRSKFGKWVRAARK